MKRLTLPILGLLLLFAGSWGLRSWLVTPDVAEMGSPEVTSRRHETPCRRIISLSPSVTETLYALGLGHQVIGVTRFCDWPPEVLDKPRIGGFYDLDYEAIITMNPDLAVMMEEHERYRHDLSRLGIDMLVVDHSGVEGIIDSLERVGRRCHAEAQGKEVATRMRQELAEIRQATTGRPRPKVLVAVGRDIGSGTVRNVYIAGSDTYYDQLLAIAGGINAYQGRTVKYPTVSAEGIIKLNPDVILEMAPDLEQRGVTAQQARQEWFSLQGVAAVDSGRVHVLTHKYAVVPGPRVILLLRDLAELLHPGVANAGHVQNRAARNLDGAPHGLADTNQRVGGTDPTQAEER